MLQLATLDGTSGFRFDGQAQYDSSGFAVSSAGDVDGDGFDDVIIGAINVNFRSGAAYVLFGHAGTFDAVSNPASLDGTNGFQLKGGTFFGQTGSSVSSAGDINGDGFDDLLVGAPGSSSFYSAGSAYVVYGHAGGFGTSIDLSSLGGTTGFRLVGAGAHNYAGFSVSSAGDVNGDGFADLMVGTRGSFNDLVNGQAYVLFGGNFTTSVTQLGDAGNNTLTGTSAADRFVAGNGNDTMFGNGGADVFDGGAGNDLMRVGDLTFQRADGGGNDDRLLFEAAAGASIDLSNLHGRIQNMEQLDTTNGIANTLTLALGDVLDLHVRNNDVGGVGGLDNAVKILGDANDTVDLVGSFTQEAGGAPAGFELYHFDAAPEQKIVVQQGVTVI